MKRLIVAGLLLAGVVAACIFGSTKVTVVCNRCTDDLQEICATYTAGDVQKARKDAEKIGRDFERQQRTLSLFVNHKQLDDISQLLLSLPQEETDFLSTASSASFLIADLKSEFGYGLEGFF